MQLSPRIREYPDSHSRFGSPQSTSDALASFVEAAEELRRRACNVSVVSLARTEVEKKQARSPQGVVVISKEREHLEVQLSVLVKNNNIDVIFWPMTWREPKWRINVIRRIPVARVGYIPSGVFDFHTSIYALYRLGWRTALPYIVDSLLPRGRLIRLAARARFTDIIALSQLTAHAVVAAGWNSDRVHYIPPGKGPPSNGDRLPRSVMEWLNNEPFFLFMGPPSRIRSVEELLAAFERAAACNPAFRLICLFRPDDELDTHRIMRAIAGSHYGKRIRAEWEVIDRETLDAYMTRAKAIVMPFILVPSEIPLAIIEALSFHTPTISTSPGGTGDFVQKCGFAPKVGDIAGLSDAMLTLIENADIYRAKCHAAALAHNQLDSWSGMADKWLQIAYSAKSEHEVI